MGKSARLTSETVSPRASNKEQTDSKVYEENVEIMGTKAMISPHLSWKIPANFSFYSPRSVSRTKINKIRE